MVAEDFSVEDKMPVHIIDNRKIDMTPTEWDMYIQICRSYDRPSFKGEELFRDLFETDDNGLIMFLRPPSNRHISMEVFMFMSIIMQHQHLRLMHQKVDDLCNELKEKVSKLIENK
jgi:hypothetical protein